MSTNPNTGTPEEKKPIAGESPTDTAPPKEPEEGKTVPVATHIAMRERAQAAEAKIVTLEKRITDLEAQINDVKRKEAEEQGRFEELYNSTSEELKQTKGQMQKVLIDASLKEAAIEVGAKTKIINFVDRSMVSVDERGNVTGAVECVQAFLDENPEFAADKASKPMSPGAAPATPSGQTKLDTLYAQWNEERAKENPDSKKLISLWRQIQAESKKT